MKKIFFLACTAVLFAACSNETTEEVMFNSEIVKATLDTRAGTTCSARGSQCEFLQSPEFAQGQQDHWHCIDQTCEKYYGYFTTMDEAWNHCKSNQGHHGGKGSFE